MIYGFLILIFLEGILIFLLTKMHSKTVENLVRRYDQRERELLDRLMYVTKTPWNLPPRVDSEESKEEQPPNTQWRDY
jgi:hypothetical protein